MDNLKTESLVDALRRLGEASLTSGWLNGDPNYVAEYSLTLEQIPALVSLATQWIEEPSDNAVVYGPVHAWRALGQLRAVEAVQPLLDVQDDLDVLGDDWYVDEFPDVFGLMGPPAIEALAAFLADESHGEFPRACAGNGLREIASHFPDTRGRIVGILTTELSRHQQDVIVLNGLLVADLLDLDAVESAESIERAFAANVIDPTVAGDWKSVREELGVPGLGLAANHTLVWPSSRECFDILDSTSEPPGSARLQQKQREARSKAKAQRKLQKKSRKRNRQSR